MVESWQTLPATFTSQAFVLASLHKKKRFKIELRVDNIMYKIKLDGQCWLSTFW